MLPRRQRNRAVRSGLLAAALVLGLGLPLWLGAQAPAGERYRDEVVTDSSKTKIEVGITYHGESIDFFGALGDTGADAVIVKLLSPPEKVKLNQKGRFGPFWMNLKQHEVENVPFLYLVNASAPFESILSPALAEELEIGLVPLQERMQVATVKGQPDPADADLVRHGLLQLKMRDGLYRLDDQAVTIKSGRLFKHTFAFPAATREGDYQVVTYLFREGRLLHQTQDTVHVSKTGLVAHVARWSRDYPKLYGLCAVAIALAAGLLVGFVFKKGGH